MSGGLARAWAQGRFDAAMMLRNGEQVLLTLILPALLLIALARTSVPELGPGRRIDVLVPGVLALAVMSTAFTGQAIQTGFDRRYGVLRLLGTTPLGRSGLLAGRVLAVGMVQAVQVAVLGALGAALGWRPTLAGVAIAVPAALIGTAAFTALGLALAGTLRAEAVLAVANLIWVLLLVGGGVVIPAGRLAAAGAPGWLAAAAGWLPSGALGDALRAALIDARPAWAALAVLVGWALSAGWAASRWFRWD